ncbi:MAG: hypothetical protein ABF651_09815 [Sporolactobacillus sp.]
MEKKRNQQQSRAKLTDLYQQEAKLEQQLIQIRNEIDRLEGENDDFDQRHAADMKRLSEIEESFAAILQGKKNDPLPSEKIPGPGTKLE